MHCTLCDIEIHCYCLCVYCVLYIVYCIFSGVRNIMFIVFWVQNTVRHITLEVEACSTQCGLVEAQHPGGSLLEATSSKQGSLLGGAS